MTIISKYITRTFFKYFCIVLCMVTIVYLSVDFFGQVDDFIEDQVPLAHIAAYFMYEIPFIIAQITPVAVLLGVLIIFGLMTKHNEIIAIKSSGISIFLLIKPIFFSVLFVSVALFIFSEVIVPISMAKQHELDVDRENRKELVVSSEQNIWLRGEESIVHIKHYDIMEQTIFGVSIIYFDEDFRLARRIDANRGVFVNGSWRLYDCMAQNFTGGGNAKTANVLFYKEKEAAIDLNPSELRRVTKEPKEMNILELRRHARKIEREGYDATRYWVEAYAKTAYPFICLIMSLIGSGIALRGRTREGMAVSFGYGVALAFVYWTLYSFCLSLGYGDILPPFAAAWAANFLFLCASGIMVINLD